MTLDQVIFVKGLERDIDKRWHNSPGTLERGLAKLILAVVINFLNAKAGIVYDLNMRLADLAYAFTR